MYNNVASIRLTLYPNLTFQFPQFHNPKTLVRLLTKNSNQIKKNHYQPKKKNHLFEFCIFNFEFSYPFMILAASGAK